MDQINGAGEFGEESGFFTSAVATTDDADGDVAVEGTVAGGATGQPVADEALFIGQAEVLG